VTPEQASGLPIGPPIECSAALIPAESKFASVNDTEADADNAQLESRISF